MKLFFTLYILFLGVSGFAQLPSIPSSITHKVESNQTLYAISRLYHVSPQVLMKNNPQFGPDFHLKTGSLVKVPAVEVKGSKINSIALQPATPKQNNTISSPATAITLSTTPAKAEQLSHQEKYAKLSTHIVRNGETIESIANEEQVSAADLIALNKTKIAHLKAGDVVFVKEYWLPIEGGPSASIQQINRKDAILSNMTKEKYDNELLFMNESR